MAMAVKVKMETFAVIDLTKMCSRQRKLPKTQLGQSSPRPCMIVKNEQKLRSAVAKEAINSLVDFFDDLPLKKVIARTKQLKTTPKPPKVSR